MAKLDVTVAFVQYIKQSNTFHSRPIPFEAGKAGIVGQSAAAVKAYIEANSPCFYMTSGYNPLLAQFSKV